jgi:hypothetical protein
MEKARVCALKLKKYGKTAPNMRRFFTLPVIQKPGQQSIG